MVGADEIRIVTLPSSSKNDVPRSGTICAKDGNRLWDTTDVDEGYKLFERNFPHLDIRTLIPHAEMRKFLGARVGKFRDILMLELS